MRLLLILLMSAQLMASIPKLSPTQIEKIQIGYDTGKKIKASDGTTFEKTLPSMMATESSWGKMTLGDKYRKGKRQAFHKMSFGNYQVKVSTAQLTIKKYPKLKRKYGFLLKNRKMLIHSLRYNSQFGAEIAGHYLLSMYEEALKKKRPNAYKRAIGRYNGGWNNMTYANKVLKEMKVLNKLIAKKVIRV